MYWSVSLSKSTRSNRDEATRLAEFYTSAGQYYATSLLAVAFGQFSVLVLLASRAGQVEYWGATLWLAIVYVLIVFVGCYFVFRAAIFAQLEEQALRRSNLMRLDTRMQKRVNKPNLRLEIGRRWLIRRPYLPSLFYVGFSTFALLAVLYLPSK